MIFKPETLVRWHRSGFRLYWHWMSRLMSAGRRLWAHCVFMAEVVLRDAAAVSRESLLRGSPIPFGY